MLMATTDRSRTNSEDTTIERVVSGTPPPSPMLVPLAAPPLEPDDPIGALMSTPVAWVEPTVSLMEVAATLEAEGVGAAAVLSGDHFDGVVSERDVVRALSRGGVPSDVWVVDVMTAEPVYVDPDEPIITVAERMLDEGVRHLPVVSDGQVVGVVSVRDALRVLADAWRRARRTEEA
jgi:CBS domain-containing protein